jgi:hypothetical protein
VSYYAEEPYDLYKETPVRSRKDHRCSACKQTIPPKVTYWKIVVVFDGTLESLKRCSRCQKLHKHLRELGRERDMWPDERLACGKLYQDEWGDVPVEIAALAFELPGDQKDEQQEEEQQEGG